MCIMVYWVTMCLEGMTPLQLLHPPCMFPGSRGHEACFALIFYFIPCLHYLLASFNPNSLTWTVVAGNLVAVWRKLHCGDKNIFGCGRNNLSMSTELNTVKQRKWQRKGGKGGGKVNPFVWCSPCPLSFLLGRGWAQHCAAFINRKQGNSIQREERMIHPIHHILPLQICFDQCV